MYRVSTYWLFVKLTAVLLIAGIALPSGLHAKKLVDFCLTPVEQSGDMPADHSCCPPDSDPEKTADHHATHSDCEWDLICACHIDRPLLIDQNWTTPKHIKGGVLAEIATLIPEVHADRFIHHSVFTGTYATPSLFLLNSTFLN